jgi:hypothetical protein
MDHVNPRRPPGSAARVHRPWRGRAMTLLLLLGAMASAHGQIGGGHGRRQNNQQQTPQQSPGRVRSPRLSTDRVERPLDIIPTLHSHVRRNMIDRTSAALGLTGKAQNAAPRFRQPHRSPRDQAQYRALEPHDCAQRRHNPNLGGLGGDVTAEGHPGENSWPRSNRWPPPRNNRPGPQGLTTARGTRFGCGAFTSRALRRSFFMFGGGSDANFVCGTG